jgi:hypothetical protein
MAVKEVTLKRVGNSIQVDPYVQVLIMSRKDRVKWKTDPPGLDFVVCFADKTPFKHKHFFKSRALSGPI